MNEHAVHKAVNRQRETHPRDFVRVLGRPARACTAKMKMVEQFGLFMEAFGAPERKQLSGSTTMLSWNFIRWDRGHKDLFSLMCRIPSQVRPHGRLEVEVHLAAGSGVQSFMTWTLDRMGAVENGEEPPVIIGAADFAIARA